MFPLRFAKSLILFAACGAPWVAGAPTSIPHLRWYLGGSLAAAFLLTIVGRRGFSSRPLNVPLSAAVSSLFLLACLGWWATQPEPPFATRFGADLWSYLGNNDPLAVFHWPRAERLFFITSVILGFLAATDLGRSENFRTRLLQTIAISGLGFAIYAIGFAHSGWPALPWTLIKDGPEQNNLSFAHYSAPPACLNLAWPLLLFGVSRWHSLGAQAAAAGLVALALFLWPSAAGQSIAAGLLLAGVVWLIGAKRGWLTPKQVYATLVAALVAIFVSQCVIVRHMQTRTPDGWRSAEDTLVHADARDVELRALASRRGDRLVMSAAPDRPAGWLSAFRMALDFPLIGLGPGAWVKRSALYTRDSFVSTFSLYRQYAHHDLLQFAAEWGGLPTVAAVFLWLGGFWNAVYLQRARLASHIGIVLALLGVALHSTVDFPLQNPALQLWTALLLGLAWSRPVIPAHFNGMRGNSARHPRLP